MRLAALGLLLVAAGSAVACGDSDAASDDGSDVAPIVQSQVHVIAGTPGTDYQVEPDRITASAAHAPDLAERNVGDVLVSDKGILRRVRDISKNGDNVVLTTDPGTFEDLFQQVHVGGDLAPKTPQGTTVPALGYSTPESVSLWIPELSFADRKLDLGSGSSITLVAGSFKFQPKLDFDLTMHGAHVEHFLVSASGTSHADLSVHYDLDKAKLRPGGVFLRQSNGTPVAEADPFNAVFWVGYIPVVVSVKLTLLAGWDINFDGDLYGDVAFQADGSATAGLEYKDGGWNNLAAKSLSVSEVGHSTLAAHTVTGDVTLTARLDLTFYEVAGPYIALQGYAGIRNQDDQQAQGWFTQMGIRGLAGAQVSVFGKALAGYETTLFDVHEQTPLP